MSGFTRSCSILATNIKPLDIEIIAKGRVLSQDEAQMLCRPFSREKIKKVLLSIPEDKAPGLDGFSSGFFKAAWPTIGDDFTTAILDFFRNGKILGQINSTNITLVPKVKCSSSVSG